MVRQQQQVCKYAHIKTPHAPSSLVALVHAEENKGYKVHRLVYKLVDCVTKIRLL